MRTRSSTNTRSKKALRKKTAGLRTLKFFGSEFVLNTATGMFYRVTPTAILILKALQQGADNGALAEVVQKHCTVSRMTAVRDIELLINELAARGILTPDDAESGKWH